MRQHLSIVKLFALLGALVGSVIGLAIGIFAILWGMVIPVPPTNLWVWTLGGAKWGGLILGGGVALICVLQHLDRYPMWRRFEEKLETTAGRFLYFPLIFSGISLLADLLWRGKPLLLCWDNAILAFIAGVIGELARLYLQYLRRREMLPDL